ncbi:hypothetical protein, partial [Ectothiorhodospira lacustris]|uniref:hypothetical protein n=1 Tax=Ectothiorhodospira lacustris TaxID=2899127 RepID=UPI001EE85648
MTLKRYIILLLGSGLLLLLAIQWWLTYQAAEAMSLRLQTRLAEEVSIDILPSLSLILAARGRKRR